jgi:hypothetical protein
MNKEYIDFLVRAKLATYAANETGEEQADGSKILELGENGLLYVDHYYGFNPFSGREQLVADGKTVWMMNYRGEIFSEKLKKLPFSEREIYDFLRQALRNIPPKYPFRGPARLEKEKFLYFNRWQRNCKSFHGNEIIVARGSKHRIIYQLYYHGGIIR